MNIQNKKASVLIFAMFIVIFVAIMISAVFFTVASEARTNAHLSNRIRAYALSESGIRQVEAIWGWYGFPLLGVDQGPFSNINLDLNGDGNIANIQTIYLPGNQVQLISTADFRTSRVVITATYQDFDIAFTVQPRVGRRIVDWRIAYQRI
jgi:hypothetical protein